MTTMSLLLDTDIGSDIDDGVCLSMLLREPRCELVGITTVSGRDPRVRASLADAVCRAAGRTDIPIHSGSATSLTDGAVVQPEIPQASVLANFSHRPPADFPSCSAVTFLHDTICARPGEITLLGIGPMTNLALLFALDPTIGTKLKGLVLMNGLFFKRDRHGYHRRAVGRTQEWEASKCQQRRRRGDGARERVCHGTSWARRGDSRSDKKGRVIKF